MKSKPNLSSGSVRQKVIIDTLSRSTGQKVFLLIQAYPFVIIGSIVTVMHDFLLINIEANSISEIQNGTVHVKIEDIEAFYIEEAGPKIR
ncbi:hypothetical protein [Halalkalibacter alkalisediminis]|uniref:Uncharacterized protein n=1 Tax=Halalkalibacter alkalisediminis TaxID=935616 RepID=A0ABV6NPP4_9BACI|nr:hypothetical protein [Halalkalibacter alkalisediminis]